MAREISNLTLEDARFIFQPNFEGRPTKFNAKGGEPSFNVIIPEDLVPALQADGWNLKWTRPGPTHPNPDEHVPEPYLEVSVSMEGYRPAQVLLMRDGRPTPLNSETVGLVDSTEFESFDVIIRPYQWSMDTGASGVKAYLKKFVGVVEMDDLDRKYNIGASTSSTQSHVQEDDGSHGEPF
jgi:hypothetical protein